MASLNIPPSQSTVRVRAIDTKFSASLHSDRFLEPLLPGFETLNLTTVCYLLENEAKNKRILFDCGARKDFENYPPAIKARLNNIIQGLKIEADVNDVLEDAGVHLNGIDSIVWSHWHWDHNGAAENFPESVEVVVGPGFKENFMPGYPVNPEGVVLEASFTNRTVREISFTTSDAFQIGQFPAYDFFGDGSFYLLDTPGHAIGHICGLARTTPTTFIFMGGDICHFSGMFRPSSHLPLPDEIPSEHLDAAAFPSPCLCSHFTSQHPRLKPDAEEARSTPFFEVTSLTPSSYLDREVAMESIRRMQDFDAEEDVLVCIAHDPALLDVLPFLNEHPDRDLNDWKAEGMKRRLLWGWLNHLPRDGRPGRRRFESGTRTRGGEEVVDFTKLDVSR